MGSVEVLRTVQYTNWINKKISITREKKTAFASTDPIAKS